MKSTVAGSVPLVMLGAGGHAKVLLSLARRAGHALVGVCDPALAASGEVRWRDVTVLGDDAALDRLDPNAVALVNGIGQVVGDDVRRRVFDRCKARGFRFASLVDPSAVVDETVTLDEGAQVMAGAVVQPDARIGAGTIVNTGARIDHDCVVAAHVHVAPGATLCGAVRVGEGAFIGAGATVVPGVVVGAGAVVAAGATAARDVPADSRWFGRPAA